jgi:pimeloyl-ACP methyl ester carboxylesterase
LYLVHGFGLTWSGSIDCKDYWGTTVQRLKDKGWKGPILTVGFYKGDRNCNLYASGKKSNWDLDTDIEEIAQGLAWLINRNNPSNSIDVIGHSMGGLVVRYAIQGVAQGYSNFPSFINVEDAVTMATPNQGLPVCPFDFWNQCRQMQRGSPFMQKLKPNPQASTKTDWTAIGHSDDQIVSWESSTGAKKGRSGYLGPGHFVYFYSRNYPRASAHQRLLGGESRNSFRALHWDYHHKRLSANRDSVGTERVYVDGTPWDNSRRYNRAPDPIDWAYNAAWSWDTWLTVRHVTGRRPREG